MGNFWRGRRVFLTGHTGFKGAWLSLWLADLGAEVTGFALPPATNPNLFDLARVSGDLASIEGDIRDLDAVIAALRRARAEVVIHMAAQSLVRVSYVEPVETFAANVMGTAHVLEAVRRVGGVASVVIVTSDKCYENRETGEAYREESPMGGHDPYSASKGAAELAVAAWRRSYFLPEHLAEHGVGVASVRAGNVIGGGDWARDRLVPDLLAAFAAGEPARLRYPQAVRPWQHVLEPLGGYLIVAERLASGDAGAALAWNFGPAAADTRTVAEVADRLAALWAEGARWLPAEGEAPHEAGLLALDCRRARDRLGWRPTWSLDEALKRVVSWRKAFAAGEDPRALCLARIREHGPAIQAPFP